MARTALFLLTVLLVVGCPPKIPPPAPGPAPGHPDLVCPPGTQPAGFPPPLGREVWCDRPLTVGFVREGPTIAFHEDGAVAAKGAYIDGKPSGRWEWWYPAGQTEKSGSYVVGAPDGAWTAWHPNGKVASQGVFVSGREQGRWEFFDKAGVRFAGDYLLGDRVGAWIESDASGKPRREHTYVDGRLVSVVELDDSAPPVPLETP